MSTIETNNPLLDGLNLIKSVRLGVVIVGIVLVVFAIPLYVMMPPIMEKFVNKLTFGNGESTIASQILSQLHIPSFQSMILFTQYSCLGLAVAGLGIIIFGIVSKKIPKYSKVYIVEELMMKKEDENESGASSIKILQEKLARGEITSSQYQNLRKILEEKR